MPDSETLSPTKGDCTDHVVFIPQSRRKALSHALRRHLGEGLRAVAEPQAWRIAQGPLMAAHVPLLLARPPQDSVAQGVGFLKGQAALHRARPCRGRRKP